ncbi:related to monocarboxylate permease [Ustilago hordei]|uniref:Related to monocarboxylate permease n=1 Tax=Ustilago hordei TaxID=120017 RepID=I2FNZ0_USTHO|nr:related to monocarboxylate permease [Ustilago hordei]
MSSCYNTHSWSSANDATPTSSHCQIIPRLRLHEDSAPTAEPLPPPSSAVPLASLVAHSPLEPLFLGMDDDAVITPLPSLYLAPIVPNPMGNDHSLVSPAIDLYEVNSRCAALEMMNLECQAVWEAELAQSPTPPPAADEVIDTILLAPQAETPVYRLVVQPLTPPPHWVARRTPPPDCHLPSNGEIAGWSEQFVMAKLLTQVTDHYYPPDWDIPVGSLPAKCLHCLVMLRLMEGCMPWPSWQCRCCFNLGIP